LAAVLTGRELEVLAQMATGATNERIAQELSISRDTVKSHVTHILRKLGAENRGEAIAHYLRLTMGSL
jgi:DNA-binding CsgD family transcriptional regulator